MVKRDASPELIVRKAEPNPDGWAKEQPLKKRRAADIILLECSGAQPAERNAMKRYCGCISPTERRKRACEDEERAALKIRLPIFWLPYFLWAAKCLWNGGRRLFLPTTDWNSRTEQRERPERDLLIAFPFYRKCNCGNECICFVAFWKGYWLENGDARISVANCIDYFMKGF
jgi:hypothetical protein